MKSQQFIGTGVAVTTPFTKNKAVDFASLKQHISYLLQNGIDYFVVMGTTGESVTLNEDEKKEVLNTFIETNKGQIPIVLGLGGNDTQAVVKKTEKTDLSKVDAILSVAPYYNKPSQKGLYEHFKAVSKASPVPVILYNVPGRTGVNISAETIVKLARDFENIVAVKEASGDFTQVMHIIQDKPDDFQVVSGEDGITLPLLSIGVSGVISVAANAFPKEFSTMVNYALKNDIQSAKEIHYKLLAIIEKLFAEGNPSGIKCALSLKKIIGNNLRLPLVPVSKELEKDLKKLIGNI
ncbi:MAG: 4-hydroxy-tetrahydrodipicolinate synthase [Bacteroidales bacterium]